MNKLWIIIKREYLNRVRKKSFYIMTLLAPLLLGLMIFLPSALKDSHKKRFHVVVVDQTDKTIIGNDTLSFFKNKFINNKDLLFEYSDKADDALALLSANMCNGVLEIVSSNDKKPIKSFLYYSSAPSPDISLQLKQQTSQIFKNTVLKVDYNLSEGEIRNINDSQIDFYTKDIYEKTDNNTETKLILGIILGTVVYMFTFIYCSQVMRSVGEEKTSRIVEILASSVKSVYLLFGKIIAVALAGITQIALWVLLGAILIGGSSLVLPDMFSQNEQKEIFLNQRVVNVDAADLTTEQQNTFSVQAIHTLRTIDFSLIVSMFVVYFVLGYLLYAAFFGAIGALLDNDTNDNQFVLPLTAPLIFAMLCMPIILSDPSCSLSVWLSIIPFTSPVVMLIRLPFGLPLWQLILSLSVLALSIFGAVVFAAKIYRTAILMYGKTISFSEICRWFKRR